MAYGEVIGKCVRCGKPIQYSDHYCGYCGEKNRGWHETTQEQCGNCHASLMEGDQYCRICGTRVGEGAYRPYQDLIYGSPPIYGPPPIKNMHLCERCGYQWKSYGMAEENYCPRCGSEVFSYESEENRQKLFQKKAQINKGKHRRK